MSVAKGLYRGFSTAGWILLFLWLIRSFIGLGQYNLELAEGFILFVFLARITRTETRSGITRAIASLFGKIAGFFIITWLFLIIGGTFFGLTAALTAYTTQALLAAILTGIVAIILNNLRRGVEVTLARSPFIASPGSLVSDTNISAKITRESILLRIKGGGRTYGYIGTGELAVSLKTRIGEIGRTINGSFALTGLGESGVQRIDSGRYASDADAQSFGYKGISAFIEKCRGIYESLGSQIRFKRVDLWPFVQVEETPEGEHVKAPFVDVETTSRGERVSIAGIVVSDEERRRAELGPTSIEGDRKQPRRRFGTYTILGFNGEKIRIEAQGSRVEMHAEDYLLTVDGESTSLRRGAHSIALSRNYAAFTSPSVRAEVSQDGWATFRAPHAYIHVSGERIRFASDGEEKTLQNRDGALNIYRKIADIVTQASSALTQNERLDESRAEGFGEDLRDMIAKL